VIRERGGNSVPAVFNTENCSLFEAPSSCKTVDGTVSPKGWCMVYAKKPG
jgi:hypothetical protein